MIFTSYFSNIKNVKNPIAICAKSPNWYTGPEFKPLAPKYSFFNEYKTGKISKIEFTKDYLKEVLSLLNPLEVELQLLALYPNEKDITLLCFEEPHKFCHRQIVIFWFNKNGVMSQELE